MYKCEKFTHRKYHSLRPTNKSQYFFFFVLFSFIECMFYALFWYIFYRSNLSWIILWKVEATFFTCPVSIWYSANKMKWNVAYDYETYSFQKYAHRCINSMFKYAAPKCLYFSFGLNWMRWYSMTLVSCAVD